MYSRDQYVATLMKNTGAVRPISVGAELEKIHHNYAYSKDTYLKNKMNSSSASTSNPRWAYFHSV
jgi:hypothetical protein